MVQAGIDQRLLADILEVTPAEMSITMKRELAVKEQNDIVARIREYDALRKRDA